MEIIGVGKMKNQIIPCMHFVKTLPNGNVSNIFLGLCVDTELGSNSVPVTKGIGALKFSCDTNENKTAITPATWVVKNLAYYRVDIDPIVDERKPNLAIVNGSHEALVNGYSFFGEAEVNADGRTFSSSETASAQSQPIHTVNWLISPPAFNKVSRDEIKELMVESFKNGINILKEVSETELDIKTGDGKLMETKSFYIIFENSYSECVVNEKSMEGAGQFCEADALHPLLMLLYLQSSFKEKYRHEDKLVKLCDEEGALIEFDYRSIDSIRATLDRMKIDTDLFRHYAAPLGLLPVIYNLAQMESVHEDMFF